MSNIHSTAIVSKSAEIAEDVQVGPYSVIGPNVKIGSGTWIGPHVVVEGYTTCLLYTSPSPRDQRGARMPSSA